MPPENAHFVAGSPAGGSIAPVVADGPRQPDHALAQSGRHARDVLLVFTASCLTYFLFFWLGGVFVSAESTEDVALRLPYWGEMRGWLHRPDTGWYVSIATEGYEQRPFSTERQTNWAFFPTYPLLLRMLAATFRQGDIVLVGWLVSLAFFLVALYVLWGLLRLDFDRGVAFRAMVLLCFYPFGFTMAQFGPDSMMLFAVCGALYFARQRQWPLAGLAAGLACATRLQGLLILPSLAYLYLKERDFRWRRWDFNGLLLVLLAPAGLLAFAAHLWNVTGNPLAFVEIQST